MGKKTNSKQARVVASSSVYDDAILRAARSPAKTSTKTTGKKAVQVVRNIASDIGEIFTSTTTALDDGYGGEIVTGAIDGNAPKLQSLKDTARSVISGLGGGSDELVPVGYDDDLGGSIDPMMIALVMAAAGVIYMVVMK